MSTLLLIDLSGIAHAEYHVSGADPNPDATSIKTIARVRALASGQPHVAICAEGGRSFRKDLDATYKANRPEHDAALQHQIALTIDTLRGDGFPVWFVKGFEADDVLASAVEQALGATDGPACEAIVIASSDKDLLQLVEPRVTVKSLTSGNVLDEATVLEKFGVRPNQIVDYLALVGDTADNIKGAKGIGAKRAAELLGKYGNLEDLFTALTQHDTNFTPALATALREFEPRMALVRQLITLRRDVPVPIAEAFRTRVPADVAVFGDEEPQTLMEAQEAPAAQAVTSVTPAPSSPSVPNEGDSGQPKRDLEWTQRIRPQSGFVPLPMVITSSHPLDNAPAPIEWERQLEPRSMEQLKQLAIDLFAARLFSAYGNAPAVMSTIMAGREFGLSTMASLRAFDIIEGKQSMKADFIRAIILKSGKAEYFRCTERTAECATFVTKRQGEPELTLSFTIEEGRKAWAKDQKSFDASGWGKNPADMLVARAGAKLARLVYPDVTHGLYCGEELD